VIVIESKGSFKNTEAFLKKMSKLSPEDILTKYAREGVLELSRSTPSKSGLTANSWNYQVLAKKGYYSITWTNSNVVDGVPIAILLQYGHGTGTGGYIEGYDYINPTLRPIFDKIADDVWNEVKSA